MDCEEKHVRERSDKRGKIPQKPLNAKKLGIRESFFILLWLHCPYNPINDFEPYNHVVQQFEKLSDGSKF